MNVRICGQSLISILGLCIRFALYHQYCTEQLNAWFSSEAAGKAAEHASAGVVGGWETREEGDREGSAISALAFVRSFVRCISTEFRFHFPSAIRRPKRTARRKEGRSTSCFRKRARKRRQNATRACACVRSTVSELIVSN